MQLQGAFPGMEDPPEMMAEPAGNVLQRDLGHHVEVEFGTDPRDRLAQGLGAGVRREIHQIVRRAVVDEVLQGGQIPAGMVRESAFDHTGLDVEVDSSGDDCVLVTRHHDHLVDEFVVGSAPCAELLAQGTFLGLGHVLDDQHLEVRPRVGLDRCDGLPVQRLLDGGGHRPGDPVPIGIGDQTTVDAGHRPGEPGVLTGREQPSALMEGQWARVGPVPFDRRQFVEQAGDPGEQGIQWPAGGGGRGQPVGRLLQTAPGVRPELRQAVVRAGSHCFGHCYRPFAVEMLC